MVEENCCELYSLSSSIEEDKKYKLISSNYKTNNPVLFQRNMEKKPEFKIYQNDIINICSDSQEIVIKVNENNLSKTCILNLKSLKNKLKELTERKLKLSETNIQLVREIESLNEINDVNVKSIIENENQIKMLYNNILESHK